MTGQEEKIMRFYREPTREEARDDEREARRVQLDHLLGVYSVGSGDWSWQDEYQKLIDRPVTQRLLAEVREDGIREPVLLGTDGRVWDGHHRITVAMHLGLDSVPVEFAARKHPEPEITDEAAWEYTTTGRDGGPSESRFRAWGSVEPRHATFRRRPAGPWVPVEEGENRG